MIATGDGRAAERVDQHRTAAEIARDLLGQAGRELRLDEQRLGMCAARLLDHVRDFLCGRLLARKRLDCGDLVQPVPPAEIPPGRMERDVIPLRDRSQGLLNLRIKRGEGGAELSGGTLEFRRVRGIRLPKSRGERRDNMIPDQNRVEPNVRVADRTGSGEERHVITHGDDAEVRALRRTQLVRPVVETGANAYEEVRMCQGADLQRRRLKHVRARTGRQESCDLDVLLADLLHDIGKWEDRRHDMHLGVDGCSEEQTCQNRQKGNHAAEAHRMHGGRVRPERQTPSGNLLSRLFRVGRVSGINRWTMKRFLILCCAAVLVGACHRESAPAGNASTTPPARVFKVALLSPGPVSDAGWNALAYEGLLAIRDQLGAQVSQIQTQTPAEFEEGFRDFARRGYQLVFGHGFEFQDAAAAVAPDFPGTVFITTSGNTVRRNVAPLRFLLEQATYLEGMLAAGMSKTGKAGVVGGIEIPSVKSTVIAFAAGAKSVRPDFSVVTTYIGNWEDVGAAKEAASALVQQGCDFLFHNADAAGLGVLRAAQENGVFAFGSNKNQNDVAPDVVIASAVIDIPRAFVQVAREVKAGRFEGKIEREGMKDGVVALVLNPRLEPRIPPDLKRRIDHTREAIIAGTVQVPTAEF